MTTLNNLSGVLRNRNDKRAGLTDLTGATFASVSNATVELVAAAANVKGIIVRYVSIRTTGGASATGTLYVGGNGLLEASSSSGGVAISDKNIFIPAGVALSAVSNNSVARVYVHYEVLA